MLAGPPALVAAAGPSVAAALGARGGGKAGRFQGKLAAALAPNAPELDAAEAACREALKNAAEATPESA